MSEQKAKYRAGTPQLVAADRRVTATFTRAEWARIGVACQAMANQGFGPEYGRLHREVARLLAEDWEEAGDGAE